MKTREIFFENHDFIIRRFNRVVIKVKVENVRLSRNDRYSCRRKGYLARINFTGVNLICQSVEFI